MTATPGKRGSPSRSYGAILFELLVLGFTGLLVVNALGLRPGVGMVPLLVGLPTVVATLLILVVELFPGLRRSAAGETAEEDGAGGRHQLMPAGSEDVDIGDGVPTDPASRRQQALFTAWVVGFVALAALTSVYVAVPIALAGILLAIRLPWLQIVVIVVATVLSFYGIFDVFLGVRL